MRRKSKPHAAGERAGRSSEGSSPSKGSVRIIGGQWRGRRIAYTSDARTRPMKDRVREAVFNLLGDLTDSVAIDLFAGTGALGFEALSRGAKAAVFIEQHFPTAESIRSNAASFGAADSCQVIGADTFAFFRRAVALPLAVHDSRWIVFCSPPYEFYVSRRDEMVRLITQLWQEAPAESAFVIEADERFDWSLLPSPDRWKVRSYPPAQIALAWAG